MSRTYASKYVHKFQYAYYGTFSYVDYIRETIIANYHGFLDQSEETPWLLGTHLRRLKQELESKWVNASLGSYPLALLNSPHPVCLVRSIKIIPPSNAPSSVSVHDICRGTTSATLRLSQLRLFVTIPMIMTYTHFCAGDLELTEWECAPS